MKPPDPAPPAPPRILGRPLPPAGLLPRPVLIARLNEGANLRLTLVSAPAGSGKTLLLAQWAEACDRPCAWLSLDAERCEIVPYVQDLIGALRTIHPELGRTTYRILRGARQPAPSKLAEALCQELDAVLEPTALVLDDFERMRDPISLEFTSVFIRRCPPSLHMAIASRTDPPLPLARLRAAGQVSELRAADLYFSPEESAVFLQAVSPRPLPPQVVDAIVDRSEGWPVGLRLAALSLSGSPSADADRLPSGRSRLVMDYFLEEVLAQTGPKIVGTFLRSSILDEISVPLLSAVARIPVSDAAQFLEYLERNNLFVIALDGREGWFRLHPLLRDTLRSRLDTVEPPQAVAGLHQLAADWFLAHGHADRAIQHALSAGNVEGACDMAEVELLRSIGNEDLLRTELLLRAVPEEVIRLQPILLAIQARVLGGRTGWHAALPILDAAQATLDQQEPSVEENAVIARSLIDVFRAPVYFFGGDAARALEYAERAQQALRGRFAYTTGWGGFFAGLSHHVLGQPDQGLRLLKELLAEGQASNQSFQVFFALLGLTVAHLLAARLPESQRTAAQMLALETTAGRAFGKAWSHYWLGILAYETNHLAEAAQHFDQVVALHQETSALALNDAMLGAALARQALGRTDEAAALLDEAEEYVLSTNSIAFLTNLHSLRARIALMQGDMGLAQAWTQATPMRLSPGPLIFMEVPPLTAARVILADGGRQAARDALALVSEVEERCHREHNLRYLIAVLSLQAVAMAKLGRQGPALEKLEASLDLARRSGFVRTFVDLGPPMAGLLHRLAPRTPHTAYVDRLLAAFAAPGMDDGGQPRSNRIEPLTPRELQILPLLQRRYSNEEIARELGISVLTVKRHTGSLYAKLQVSGRKEAVRRAGSLGLLSPGD